MISFLSYIIWSINPDIFSHEFSFGNFQLRWYGVLFALGFLVSQQILYYIFKKEGKPQADVDTLTVYMVIATIVGARLGHVFFYEPQRYLQDPIKIFKIWEGGLASHGAALGILLALWLYSRKKKPGQNFLSTVDRIVIVVAITAAFIRVGNFFNSEIIGKPTHSNSGVVFAHEVNRALEASADEVFNNSPDGSSAKLESIEYTKTDTAMTAEGYVPMKILLTYDSIGENSNLVDEQLTLARSHLLYWPEQNIISKQIDAKKFLYRHVALDSGKYEALVETNGIVRYPAQLYEALSSLILFVILFMIWSKYKSQLPQGRLLGIFLMVCFSLRFCYEFLKENQVEFENNLPINMGQILSIPLVLLGIFIFIRSFKKEIN